MALVRRAFGFLESELGYRAVGQHDSGPVVDVTYESEVAQVTIFWNLEERIIDASVAPRRPRRSRDNAYVSLFDILQYRAPERLASLRMDGTLPPQLSRELAEEVLGNHAAELRQYGSDLRNGDFSLLQQLMRDVAEGGGAGLAENRVYVAQMDKIRKQYERLAVRQTPHG